MRNVLILPCETRVREFDAKLLLACHAVERGYDVIVGWKRSIDLNVLRLPLGIYVGKSVTNRNLLMFRILRRLGHMLTAWDEEGLVYASTDVYQRTKVGVEALNEPRCLFAWGEANAEAWRSVDGFAGTPIVKAGNPRVDLLRPELRGYFSEQAAALRAEHGDFVLINTNFSRLNHYYESQSRQRKLLEDGGDAIADDADPRLGWAAHKAALFEAFKAMVPALARRFPQATIVVRPHPSENAQIWLDVSADCGNVRVIHAGNIAAWLQAARVTIHNGCTTAVESFLLDRPAIAYQPVASDEYDHYLPNGLSIQATDGHELEAHVARALAGELASCPEHEAGREALARAHIESRGGAPACELILDGLAPYRRHTPHKPAIAKRLAGVAAAEGRALFKRTAALFPNNPNHVAYQRHMFPSIGAAEVKATVARFGRLLGRFENIRVTPWEENAFRLTVRH
ncbi:MAG: hypothetical protein JJT88_09105 [Gammaproteobacteria bacterium]|nr:hypothetical protein [Gammaproteobacteria bacterium]